MSVAMSILAMVAAGPRYGYELRAEFDRRTGERWPLNVGQVYKTLERLEREGLVAKSAVTDADGHVYYEATSAGSAAATTWATSADSAATEPRDDLAIKIAIALTLAGTDVEQLLQTQRAGVEQRLETLELECAAPVSSAEQLAARVVLDAAREAAAGQLRWLDAVGVRVREAAASGIPVEMPFDVDRPRRGRPRAGRA